MTSEELKNMSTEELYAQLTKYKELVGQEDSKQQVRKILINAVYGAIGNKHFPLYNPDIADAITSQGRYSIQTTTHHVLNGVNSKFPFVKMKRVINDTDSAYFTVPGLVEKFVESSPTASINDIVNLIDTFEKTQMKPLIKEVTETNFNLLNDKELLLDMDREAIAESHIITGKKHYAIKVWDDEGTRLAHPKYKIVGLEIKRSSTPALMRKKLDEALRMLFDSTNTDTIAFIKNFEKEYMDKKYNLEEISFPTGISDMDKFDGGNISVPIHVRASLLHNQIIKDLKMDNISPICSGDKIKWVYLNPSNKYSSNVIAFNDPAFLKLVDLESKIDYRKMFDNTFTTPLAKLIESVGWKMTSTAMAMDELF